MHDGHADARVERVDTSTLQCLWALGAVLDAKHHSGVESSKIVHGHSTRDWIDGLLVYCLAWD